MPENPVPDWISHRRGPRLLLGESSRRFYGAANAGSVPSGPRVLASIYEISKSRIPVNLRKPVDLAYGDP
jgi:hypothetical protein